MWEKRAAMISKYVIKVRSRGAFWLIRRKILMKLPNLHVSAACNFVIWGLSFQAKNVFVSWMPCSLDDLKNRNAQYLTPTTKLQYLIFILWQALHKGFFRFFSNKIMVYYVFFFQVQNLDEKNWTFTDTFNYYFNKKSSTYITIMEHILNSIVALAKAGGEIGGMKWRICESFDESPHHPFFKCTFFYHIKSINFYVIYA